jgi:hypothetical protein
VLTRRQFFGKALRHGSEKTGESAEKTHVPLLLVLGGILLAVAVFGGIPAAVHFHEFGGVAVLVGLVIVAVIGGLYWIAFGAYYSIYAEEAGEREKLERKFQVTGLTLERMQTAQNQLAALTDLERGFLQQLLKDQYLRLDQINKWHPGVNVGRIYEVTTFLRYEEFDGWTVREEWRGILAYLLIPPSEQPGEVVDVAESISGSKSFWLRLRRVSYLTYQRFVLRRKTYLARKASTGSPHHGQ